MLIFDAILGAFRQIKLRGRRTDCAVCGDAPTVTELIDYVQFCGSAATDKVCSNHVNHRLEQECFGLIAMQAVLQKILTPEERISCKVRYPSAFLIEDFGRTVTKRATDVP